MNSYEYGVWRERVETILANITIPWELHLKEDTVFTNGDGLGRLYLQIQFDDVDNTDGETEYRSFCRKWYLSPHMTNQEIVRTAYLAYKQAVSHEADEKFRYNGQMIYSPHLSPDALVGVATKREYRANETPTKIV